MYERMLNKQVSPKFEDLINHCGEMGDLWLELDERIVREFALTKLIRFPYGKEYGWSVKYSQKSKHVCDIFAESGAFAALFQVSDKAMDAIYDELSDYAKAIWADKSPCKGGGWIEFRVLKMKHLNDLEKIICTKIVTKRGESNVAH